MAWENSVPIFSPIGDLSSFFDKVQSQIEAGEEASSGNGLIPHEPLSSRENKRENICPFISISREVLWLTWLYFLSVGIISLEHLGESGIFETELHPPMFPQKIEILRCTGAIMIVPEKIEFDCIRRHSKLHQAWVFLWVKWILFFIKSFHGASVMGVPQ